MLNTLLPTDGSKLLRLVHKKYLPRQSLSDISVPPPRPSTAYLREIAAIKCLFEFKIAICRFIGNRTKQEQWLAHALALHKMFTREVLCLVQAQISRWTLSFNYNKICNAGSGLQVTRDSLAQSRKQCIDYYLGQLKSVRQELD